MAAYNADIRVGITGKTQLNALERQLGRINKDLNKINKNLKAQTLTINTKGANRALDQLDRKINKLNRTVNIAINEREGKRNEGGGGSTVFASSKETTKQLEGRPGFSKQDKGVTKRAVKNTEAGKSLARKASRPAR